MYQPPLCKNDRCSKIVPPSKNPGVPRLFCSTPCSKRFHSRSYYAKEAGAAGTGMLFVNEKGQAQVNRALPPTSKAAGNRRKGHLAHCGIFNGPCPSYADPYGRKRTCLIGATFTDDWLQLMDSEQGKVVKRHATTQDGRWLVDLVDGETGEMRKTGPKGEYILTNEEREAVFESGGAKRPEEAWLGIPATLTPSLL